MNKVSITILGLNNAAGKELVDNLKKELPSFFCTKGFAETTINEKYNGEQYDMIKACMADDLVIFDASIEQNESGSWDSNYAAATAIPSALDNVLVVSRTRLPFNFFVLRTNVPERGQKDKDASGKPIVYFDNPSIVEWVKTEIEQMTKPYNMSESKTLPPRIPVSKDLKFNIPPFEQLGSVDKSLYDIQERRMTNSLDYMAIIKQKGAFISYRSHYYKNEYHGKTVLDLERIIKDFHHDNDYPVTIYAGGDLIFGFVTEQYRWYVESYVDRKLRTVDEVWIFETDHKDGYGYYDSWWTQGEIISLMYMKANGIRLPKIYVYHYDEHSKEMVYNQKDDSFIPDLTEEINHELAPYFANAEGANEGMKNMRMLRNKSFIFKWLSYWAMKNLQKHMNTMLEGYNYDAFLSSIYAHVYDKSFTDNRIIYYPNKKQHFSIDDFHRPQFIREFIHINSIRDDEKYKDEIEERGFYSIPPQEMKEIEEAGIWRVPNSNEIKKIKKVEIPQYQWWPIRKGVRTGPNNVLIERIDNWKIEKN